MADQQQECSEAWQHLAYQATSTGTDHRRSGPSGSSAFHTPFSPERTNGSSALTETQSSRTINRLLI